MDSLKYDIKFPKLLDDDSSQSESENYHGRVQKRKVLTGSETLQDGSCVVLLIGWYGCKTKHLDKYGEFYRNFGCTVIQYIPPINKFLTNQLTLYQQAKELLQLLEELDLKQQPLLFHIFSNMGVSSYLKFVHLLKNEPEFTDLCVAGVVMDSCPGKPRIRSLARAFMAGARVKDKLFAGLIEIIFMVYLYLYLWWCSICDVFTSRKHLPDCCHKVYNFHRDVMSKTLPCPHLFLYSKADNLIPVTDIEEVVVALRKRGMPIFATSWEDSPHVAHFRHHPDSYMRHCQTFLELCLSSCE